MKELKDELINAYKAAGAAAEAENEKTIEYWRQRGIITNTQAAALHKYNKFLAK